MWAVCHCGFDSSLNPETFRTDRLEDVWGGCGDDNCYAAISVWNDHVRELNKEQEDKRSVATKADSSNSVS